MFSVPDLVAVKFFIFKFKALRYSAGVNKF